jgi:ABC-type polar amino acid transport system ATPase subunit
MTTPDSSQSKDPMVTARGLCKRYGDFVALDHVDLDVAPSEVVVLVGPSGAGKSTFIRCLNGLESVDAGTITVDGQNVDTHDESIHQIRAQIGMVFQQFNLFPHLTALENVALAPRVVVGLTRAEAIERAKEQLNRVGLSDKTNNYPAELSGGQQQRVAIARSLAMQPKVMLFDEPTSALDAEMIGEVLGVMRDLAKSGMTMILVSHELGFVRDVAGRVAFFENGRILACDTPKNLLNGDAHARAREFFQRVW